jgi:4-amino-4-deoxy-L-arabinose transferase-like glycosyltransferase
MAVGAAAGKESAVAFPHKILLGIAAVALLIRLAWIQFFGLTIENEGAEYARLAENLFAGKGYVGMLGGRQTLFPPLFPVLIGLGAKIAGDAESAARAISCMSGVALIWPIYGITRLLGGERSALVAATLVTIHGLMVALSGSTYSESVYFLLLLCGLYYACGCFGPGNVASGVASGAFFGLAYLVRPEAALYPLIVAGLLMGNTAVAKLPWRKACAVALVPVLVTAVFAAPYVAWLSVNSGYFRWEGKTLTNGIIAARMNQGMSYIAASRGLGPNLEPEGPYLVADQFRFESNGTTSAMLTLATIGGDFLARSKDVARDLARTWSLGGVGLVILALLGVVAAFMEQRARALKLLFLCVGASYVVMLLSMQHRWVRHLFPFALFALPWAAIGIATLATVVARRMPYAATSGAVAISLIAVVAAPTLLAAGQLGEFSQSRDVIQKDAGAWLASFKPSTIMSSNAVFAFYARADHAYLPWAEEERALAYIRRRAPDFIALWTRDEWQVPYAAKWLREGIPDRCAVARRTFNEPPSERFVVYEWVCR